MYLDTNEKTVTVLFVKRAGRERTIIQYLDRAHSAILGIPCREYQVRSAGEETFWRKWRDMVHVMGHELVELYGRGGQMIVIHVHASTNV